MDTNRELQQVSIDELKAMLAFLNITVFNRENLKTAVREMLKVNHVDKGGDLVTNQHITRVNRILTACLDHNHVIPGFSEPCQRPSSNATFFDHYNYATNAKDDWSSYGKLFRTKKKSNAKFSHKNKFQSFFENSDEDENEMFNKEGTRGRLRPKCYNNNYDYDSSDEFCPNDKQQYSKKDNGADKYRTVRGGLTLRKPFNGLEMPEAYLNLAESDTKMNELKIRDLEANPKLVHLLPLLTGFLKNPSFDTLIERTLTFVYLEWVVALQSNCTPYTNVNLSSTPNGAVQIYLKQVEEDDIVDDRLKKGAIIQIFSSEDLTLDAKAIVETVDFKSHTITVKFSNEVSGRRILESETPVNISMDPGAFIYKAFLRGVNEILNRKMEKFIYPEPEFEIAIEEYNKFSDERIQNDNATTEKNASNNDEACSSTTIIKSVSTTFNALQLQAIDTIVHDGCGPYPFVLFGPPGTGKTATLVEAVYRITKMGKNKRVLVCATSNMAADVIALAILKQKFIHSKYVFRLNSLSGDITVRNYMLDPITCVVTGSDDGYGIPCLPNLQVYRIIVTTLTASTYLNMAGGLRGYFSHIFVDEAGQATEQETWIPIGGLAIHGVTKIALFGDHKQLGAVDQVPMLRECGYVVSMLERLMSLPAYQSNDRRLMIMLKQSYRSHELILRPASMLFYDKKLLSNKEDPKLYRMCGWSKLQNPSFPLIFHSIRGSRERRSHTYSYMNTYELNTCLDYVNELKKFHVSPSDIGIISPYRRQGTELKIVLNKYDKTYRAIAVNSVEGFQGSERRVIILLTTRSSSLGFLCCDKRLNTSITRARELLIILGDEHLLSQHLNWKKLIDYIKNHNGFVPSALMREEFDVDKTNKTKKKTKKIKKIKMKDADTSAKLSSNYVFFENENDFADPVVLPEVMSNFQFSTNAGGNTPLTELFGEKLSNPTSLQKPNANSKPPLRFTTRVTPPQSDATSETAQTHRFDERIYRYPEKQVNDGCGDGASLAALSNDENEKQRHFQKDALNSASVFYQDTVRSNHQHSQNVEYGPRDRNENLCDYKTNNRGNCNRFEFQYDPYCDNRNNYDGYTRNAEGYDGYSQSDKHHTRFSPLNIGLGHDQTNAKRSEYNDGGSCKNCGYNEAHPNERRYEDVIYWDNRHGDKTSEYRGKYYNSKTCGSDNYYQRRSNSYNCNSKNDYNNVNPDYSRRQTVQNYGDYHVDRDHYYYNKYSRDYHGQTQGRRSQLCDDCYRQGNDTCHCYDYEAFADKTRAYQTSGHTVERSFCDGYNHLEEQRQEDRNEELSQPENDGAGYNVRHTVNRDISVGNYWFDSSFEEEREMERQLDYGLFDVEPTHHPIASDVSDRPTDENSSLSSQNTINYFTNNDVDAIDRCCESKTSEESWMF